MIVECLKEILDDRFSDIYENLKNMIDNYDEQQLHYLLVNGLSLSENIVIQKYPNMTFNCYNRDRHIRGLLPMCKLLETKLNRKLKNQLYS
jgi:hypothetical protein